MCGIVGVLHQRNRVDEEILQKMADVIYHRGPDDEGFYINENKNVGLGFRRLSIIDLVSGHQPLCNEDGSVWVVFNGEIYNFDVLRKDLIQKNHKFKTNTDTECLVHGYEQYGENIFSMLNGMFGIAIWDNKQQKLLLARDRAGEKPLHYFFDGETFLFASEIKSLLVHPAINKEINWTSFSEYFSYGYIGAPRTIYTSIKKLESGNYLVFENKKIKILKYWEINYDKKFQGNYEEAKGEILRLLNDSVKIRMVSDVPLGAFLSGGIDSSTIVACMAQNSSSPIKTFSVGFDESDFDERKYARLIADKYSTDHTELILKSDLPIETIENIVLNFDEPYGDSSALPTYLISKLTKQYVTVSLSGDAGDELFGGYPSYPGFLYRKNQLESIPNFMRTIISNWSGKNKFSSKVNKKIDFIGASDDASRFIMLQTHFTDYDKSLLFSSEVNEMINSYDNETREIKHQYFENSLSFVNQMLYSDFKHYLPDDILVKVDRTSMLSSLESRAPFLDHRLIELAFSLPAEWKLSGNITKAILKDSVKNYLPENILKRSKMGFGVPLKHWFSSELYKYSNDKLLNKENKKLFNIKNISRILEAHKNGRKDYSAKIWLLLSFVIWAENNNIKI